MPKPSYIVSNFEKDILLQNIYLNTGIIIQTKRDCAKISRIISNKNDLISESTIYRLFILKNNSYTPYMHTLNLLSKFCKYENWADLIKKNQSIRNTLYPYNLEKLNGFDGILSCSIKSNDFKRRVSLTKGSLHPIQEIILSVIRAVAQCVIHFIRLFSSLVLCY